jgi:hypothetical protein
MRKQSIFNTLFIFVMICFCLQSQAAGKVLRTHLQDENYDQSLFIDELKALKTFNTELLIVEDYLQKGNTTAARDRQRKG